MILKKKIVPVWQLTSKETCCRSLAWHFGVVFEADDFGGISSAVVGVRGSLQVAAGWDPAELHIPHTNPPDDSRAHTSAEHSLRET